MICEHGRLERQCLICELKADLACVTGERDQLRKAVTEIGVQWIGAEMDEDMAEDADYRAGYEACVLIARRALDVAAIAAARARAEQQQMGGAA